MIIFYILILVFVTCSTIVFVSLLSKFKTISRDLKSLMNENKREQNHVIQNTVETLKQYSVQPNCRNGHTFGRWNVAGVSDVQSTLQNNHWDYEVLITSVHTCSLCACIDEKIESVNRTGDHSFDEDLFRNQTLKMAVLMQEEFDRAASSQIVMGIE